MNEGDKVSRGILLNASILDKKKSFRIGYDECSNESEIKCHFRANGPFHLATNNDEKKSSQIRVLLKDVG